MIMIVTMFLIRIMAKTLIPATSYHITPYQICGYDSHYYDHGSGYGCDCGYGCGCDPNFACDYGGYCDSDSDYGYDWDSCCYSDYDSDDDSD